MNLWYKLYLFKIIASCSTANTFAAKEFFMISKLDVDGLGRIISFSPSSLTFEGAMDVAEFTVVGFKCILM